MRQTNPLTGQQTGPWASVRNFINPQNSSNYQERIEEVPDKLQRPAELSIAYARVMEESGNLAEARAHYLKALEHRPNDVAAIVGLARIDRHEGNIDAAERGFRKALTLDPNNAEALHGLGLHQAQSQQWSDATNSLNRAVLAAPNDTSIRYDLAVALVQTGDIDAAMPHFIRTVGTAEAHYNVGLILHQRGELAASEEQFRMAIARKPDMLPAQKWLETVQEEQQTPPRTTAQSRSRQNDLALALATDR